MQNLQDSVSKSSSSKELFSNELPQVSLVEKTGKRKQGERENAVEKGEERESTIRCPKCASYVIKDELEDFFVCPICGTKAFKKKPGCIQCGLETKKVDMGKEGFVFICDKCFNPRCHDK